MMSDQGIPQRNKPGPKPRDRSASDMSVDEAQREGIIMGDSRDSNAAVEQERVRVPLNSGQIQSLRGYQLDNDNFHYHWFYDSDQTGSRILSAKDAFYEHCELNGVVIKAPSGSGFTYLMRLPMRYYKDDLAAARKVRESKRVEQARLGKDQYSTDEKGRVIESGEMSVRRSSSENPYG